jgi:hypothetical protein
MQNIDYFVVTMRHGNSECKTDVFFEVNNDESYQSLEHVLQKLKVHPKINELENNGTPKKPAKKKAIKKTTPKKRARKKKE